jgi:YbbR domain-containing protein
MPSLLKRVFVQNLGLKIIALLLAIGLWLVVARSPVAEVVLNVPIVFEHVPDKLEIQTTNSTEAQIRVRGPERLVSRLRSADVSAHVDLAALLPGTHTFDLTPKNVHVPNSLEVVQVNPPRVTVMMERSQ